MLLLGFTAAVAVICGRVAVRQLIWPIAASLLGLALLLPTLIVQLELTRGMAEKEANFGMGFEQGLLATLAPFPFTRAEGFMGLPANREQVLETAVVLRRDLPHGLRVSQHGGDAGLSLPPGLAGATSVDGHRHRLALAGPGQGRPAVDGDGKSARDSRGQSSSPPAHALLRFLFPDRGRDFSGAAAAPHRFAKVGISDRRRDGRADALSRFAFAEQPVVLRRPSLPRTSPGNCRTSPAESKSARRARLVVMGRFEPACRALPTRCR